MAQIQLSSEILLFLNKRRIINTDYDVQKETLYYKKLGDWNEMARNKDAISRDMGNY